MTPSRTKSNAPDALHKSKSDYHHSKDLSSEPTKQGGKLILKILLPLVIIALGLAGAGYLQKTTPKAHKRQPKVSAPLVKVQPVFRQRQQVIIKAMGTIIAARKIELKSKVAGDIIQIDPNFVEGGQLKKGANILRLDRKDYELALALKKRALADARYEYEVEQGYQAVAKREWNLLGANNQKEAQNADLALRKPHLKRARARLEAAQADLEKAELDLSRTVVQAPFNAIILAKHVDVGARVNTNEPMAVLVDTDRYWARVSVPLNQLQWIRLPSATDPRGASVEMTYRNQFHRTATVSELLNDLGNAGQMARLLVSIDDPLGLTTKNKTKPPLLIGEVVEVDITGGEIENAFRIPRRALRDQDRIWVVKEETRLDIRPITIAWRDEKTVLVAEGLKDGDQIIVSDLSTPVAGMRITVAADSPTANGSGLKHPNHKNQNKNNQGRKK